MASALDSLKDELFDNLMHHKLSIEEGHTDVYDIHQCDEKEQEIRDKYKKAGMSDDVLVTSLKEVESKIFKATRHAVDSCLVRLRSAEHEDQYSGCIELMSQLFSPFYRRSSYDAADYFASKGGVETLVHLISSSQHSEASVCTVALTTAQEFMSSDGRTDMMMQSGILPVVVGILNRACSPIMKSKAAGVLCALLDVRSAQIEAVNQGALLPIINIAMSTENELTDIESAVACLHCCSSNSLLVDEIIDAGTVWFLCDLADTVDKRHAAELNDPDCLEIVKKLPRMIKFMCHATNGLLYAQKAMAQWRPFAEKCGKELELHRSLHKEQMWRQALHLAMEWMKTETPESVWEAERDRYVWPVLHPFTMLLSCLHPVVRHIGAFSLAKLCLGPNNRKTLLKEEGNGVDLLQLSTWHLADADNTGLGSDTSVLCSLAWHQILPQGLNPPCLKSICLHFIGKHFISRFVALFHVLPRGLRLKVTPFL